jgi:hypothetical protein
MPDDERGAADPEAAIAAAPEPSKPRPLQLLGPGLVTASDQHPARSAMLATMNNASGGG